MATKQWMYATGPVSVHLGPSEIIDTPPILAVTDPLAVAPRVDGVLLVIRLAQNGGPAALDALVQIALSPGPDAPDYAKLALYGIGAVERLTEHQHDLDPDGSFGLRTLLERAGAAMPD